MNDLDERLRDTLHGYAKPVRDRVDLDVVLAGGERLRRRRRTRWVAGAVVVGVAMGVGSYGVASHRPVSGVPAPVASVSATPTTAGTATSTSTPGQRAPVTAGTKTADSSDLPASASLRTLTVTVKANAEVTVIGQNKAGVKITRTGTVMDGPPYVARLNDRVWVLVGTSLAWAQGDVDTTLPYPTYSSDLFTVGGLAVHILAAEAGQSLVGFVWTDTDGNFLDDRGDPLDSATFSAGGVDFWYVRDVRLRMSCVGWDGGGRSCSSVGAGEWSASGGGWGYTDGHGRRMQKDFQVLVVPEGASAPVVLAKKGCDSAVGALSVSGRPVVLMSCDVSGSKATVFPAIQYLDASGNLRLHQE